MERPELPKVEDFDLDTLMGLAETLASEEADGHLSLLRFTTGWKAVLGTPDLFGGSGTEEVKKLRSYPTLKDALVGLLLDRQELERRRR